MAQGKEHEYVSATGDRLRWTFQAVEEIQALVQDQLVEGTEVYWQFFERVDRSAADL